MSKILAAGIMALLALPATGCVGNDGVPEEESTSTQQITLQQCFDSPPPSVGQTGSGPTYASMGWQPLPSVEYYRVQRTVFPQQAWTMIADHVEGTYYTDLSVQANHLYQYQVGAIYHVDTGVYCGGPGGIVGISTY